MLDRIQSLPGVKSASLINSVPFGMMFIQGDFDIEGQPKPTLFAGTPKIDAGYFKTMGIPLLAGREFTAQDTAAAPKVAIISERIVREYFPGGPAEALGRRVRVSDRGEWLTVVGVVADIRQRGLDQDVKPMIYAPFQQDARAGSCCGSCRSSRARPHPAAWSKASGRKFAAPRPICRSRAR